MGITTGQFRWLMWKNFILQIRRPIGTAFEILVPLVLTALLVVARVGLEVTFDRDMCFVTHQPTTWRTGDGFQDLPISLPAPPPVPSALPFTLPSGRPDIPLDQIYCNLTNNCGELAWYPQTDLTNRLMVDVARTMQLSLTEIEFDSEDHMVQIVSEDYDKYYAAIVFDFNADGSALPLFTPYRIRISSELSAWFTGLTYPYYILTIPFEYNAYDDRFLELEHAVDFTIMSFQSEEHGTSERMMGIRREVQRFPYPEWRVETFLSTMQFLMPIIMCLSLIYSAGSITKELVIEKETKLKESMKMMGLSNWLHWVAWFTKCFLFLMVAGFIMSIFLKGGEVFRYSDYGCTLLLLTLWIMAGIMWNFAVSVLFSKAKIAMVAAVILWYLNYVCVEFLLLNYFGIPTGEKVAACLLHNTCLGIAIQTISRLESFHVGMRWDTLTVSPAEGYDVPIAAVYVMFFVDCIVYGLIAWYIEAIFPGDFGIPKPVYFPFTKSYWCGPSAKSDNSVSPETKEAEMGSREDDGNHEPDPPGMKAGIKIHNLRKVYQSSVGTKVAVDNLSLNMYENQITSLLGHNGAGKTTTMSILTGLFPPTAGTAYVNDFNISTEMDSIRQSLGLCPQHNILFDRLTVKEHLNFFLGLKGIVGDEAEAATTEMIKDLKLFDKTDYQSSELSGGMMRKLSVGIALIGQPKVVLLDEPTSGMDPYARRSTWDLLLKHKAGKTFILTTHSMDEADLLGDRIAIMARGNLICSGSSLFLKNKYGIGYHLVLVKEPGCNVGEVDNRIHSFVPNAELTTESGAELSYVLPREDTAVFTAMCKHLEDNRGDLGIASFGISVTTMEEVFLKVDQMVEEEAGDEDSLLEMNRGEDNIAMNGKTVSNGRSKDGEKERAYAENGESSYAKKGALPDVIAADQDQNGDIDHTSSMANILRKDKTEVNIDHNAYEQAGILTGATLKLLQFKAIFVKRLLHSKRDKKAIITQLIVPLIFVLFGLLLLVLAPAFGDDEPRTLTMHNISKENDKAFTYAADLRMGSDDRDILQYLPDVLSEQGLPMRDITQESLDLREENSGRLLNGENITDKFDCCNYKYQILNKNCSEEIHDSAVEDKNMCSEDPDFAYYNCPYCVTNTGYYSRSYNDTCPVGSDVNIIEYMNTYYEEYILRESSVGSYFNDLVAGVTMVEDRNNTNTTLLMVWYSNQPMHANAEALAVVDNSLLKYATNDSYNLLVTNHPLPGSTVDQVEDETQQSLILAICAVFGLGFLSASFAPFLIHEKASKSKLLQFVSGLDPLSYWLGTLVWDAINYGVVLVLLVFLFGIFPTAYGPPNLWVTTLLLVLYGWASIPMVYSLSWPFESPLAGYGLIALLLAMGSMCTLIVVFILEMLDHTKQAAVICDYIFMLLPTHCLGRALVFLAQNVASIEQCTVSEVDRQLCESSGIEYNENLLAWDFPGVGQHCLYMALEGLFWLVLTLLLEVNFFVPSRSPKYLPSANHEDEDGDVAQERQKVNALLTPESSGQAVVLTNLTKVYSGVLDDCRKVTRDPAVDHLSLTIPKGECFGLLGINGAGKTSTFRMMTGDLSISAGTAYMDGYNIQTEKREVQQRIGYCPQFDALVENLTGRELLRMYARLRGIQSHMIEAVVESCIHHIYLESWADKMCGNYSGGNKRKLSTAIAMVGNPPILFLDEPTAGMDPRARRFLWNSITQLMKGGRSIVLTSHSMEECEALCTRMAIMVNGQFKCLGSTQHLKSKFGSGYSLMVKVDPKTDTASAKEFVESKFPGAILLEEHLGMMQYRIDNTGRSWSSIFGAIEEIKEELQLIDYSVSQTSLEQVFIDFAKEQNTDERKT